MPKLDQNKINAVKAILKINKLDGVVVSDYTDMKYLLGDIFLADEAILLVHTKGLYVTSRSLYVASVKAAYPQIEIDACDVQRELQIVKAAKKLGLKKVTFDPQKETYAKGKAFADAGFTAAPSLIDGLRVTKLPQELLTMKKAAQIALAAFTHIQKFLKPGMTEKQVALEMEMFMRSKGASGLSFDSIVAFGDGGSNPHYATGEVKLKKNMPVLLDYGCVYQGYCSDMTRTFWYGDKPSDEFKKVFKVVKGAYDAVIKTAKPGMIGADIDAIARKYIEDAGYGKYFTHGLGHGIGMNIHEDAYVNQNNTTKKIMLNYCFSVEPGIYLTGNFGVRYEDCYYMTQNGPVQIAKAKVD